MPFDYAISAFLTLFVVVDPVGLTPTFLAVTDGLPRAAPEDDGAAGEHNCRLNPCRLYIDRRLAPRDVADFARRIPDRRRAALVFRRWSLGFAFAAKAKPLSRPSKSMCATSRRFR